jgi:two-component system, sensor histidine kinase and response regulator
MTTQQHQPDAKHVERRVILLADDEFAILSLLRDTFEEAGYAVIIAHDGREAFAKAQALPPDIVVTDLMMPRLDGVGLCRKLRADIRTAHIPIVGMSAAKSPPEHGFTAFFAKPFDIDKVLKLVHGILATS